MISNPKSAPVSPLLALSFAILAVSTSSIFIRFAQQETPSLVIAALRLSFATIVLAPLAIQKRRPEICALKREQVAILVLSGLFLAIHFATWITSLEYTSVASSVVLVQTTPLWVALLSPLFLGERTRPIVLAGLFLALLGGAVVGLGNACQFISGGLVCTSTASLFQGKAMFGNLLALAGAVSGSGYLLIGRNQRAHLSLLTYTFIVYGSAAVFLLFGVLFSRESLIGYPPIAYGLCLGLALIPQLLGHSTFNWALRYLPVAYVSVALLGEPVGTTLLATVILHQIPTSFELVGGLSILTGIYLTSRA